jgi:hypothetical protein
MKVSIQPFQISKLRNGQALIYDVMGGTAHPSEGLPR